MELALYCPLYGYYEKKRDTTGKRGDFYTSVSVGSLFGELLAFQFDAWFTAAAPGGATRLRLAEAGAHDGRLARDILNWFKRQRPALFEHLEYFYSRGLKYVKSTDVSRDGVLEGPAFDFYQSIIDRFPEMCVLACR